MIVQDTTRRLREYITEKNINLSEVARKTGISYTALRRSVGKTGRRDLKADELLSLCAYLQADPVQFSGTEENKEV